MSQLGLIELPPPEWIDGPVFFPEESISAQLVIPEIERLQRAIDRRRQRRERRAVPSRAAYLPGDRGDPPRRAGKVQPRRFNSVTMLKALPGLIPEFLNERVPDEFWSWDADAAGPIAVVACPCGEEVEVPETQTQSCKCERWYLSVTDRVLVGKAPAAEASLSVA